MKPAIYIGWTGYGNLGDEAMFEACAARFSGLKWLPFDRWHAQPDAKGFASRALRDPKAVLHTLLDELRTGNRLRALLLKPDTEVKEAGAPVAAILAGGTLINATDEFLINYRTMRDHLNRPVPVFSCGVKTPDFWAGKGDWQDRTREWVELLAELPVVGVRGPLSKQALDAAGARNVEITGDPAVWFHRPAAPAAARAGRKRIGVNCGTAKHVWGDLQKVQEEFALLVHRLVKAGHAVELFAICPEDLAACAEVARMANAGVAPPSAALTTYEAFARKVEDFDLIVALKLHAGVLAGCANVPFLMVEYQPKCRDFCASIGWEEYNVRSDRARADELFVMVDGMLGRLEPLRGRLCKQLCDLKTKFETYCERLDPILNPETQPHLETAKVAP